MVLGGRRTPCRGVGDALDGGARRGGAGFWRYELWNALIVSERGGRLTAEDARQTLADLAEMRIERDGDHDEARLLALARQWGLSAYDAAYLEVAVRRQLAIASLDNRLVDAATGADVPLVGR